MPDESSSSVKIVYFDRARALREVREVAQALYRRHPEIEAIYLFGSLAAGTPVPGSDADLLIVLSSSPRRFLDRIPQYLPRGLSVGTDVFPYTSEELQRMVEEGNPFVQRALATGVKMERAA